MKTIVTTSIYWLSGATVISTALVPVLGALAVAGLIPLSFYCYLRNLNNLSR